MKDQYEGILTNCGYELNPPMTSRQQFDLFDACLYDAYPKDEALALSEYNQKIRAYNLKWGTAEGAELKELDEYPK